MKILKKISLVTLTYMLVISFTGCSLLNKITSTVLSSISSHSNVSSSEIIVSSSSSSSSMITSSVLASSSAASSSNEAMSTLITSSKTLSSKVSTAPKVSSSKHIVASSSAASSIKPPGTASASNNVPVIPVVQVDTNVPDQPVASSSSTTQSTNGLPATFADFWGGTGMQGIKVYEYGKGLLNSNERTVYDQLISNITQVNNGFIIKTTCEPNSINKIFEYFYYDHSEIFYFHGGFSYSYSSTDGNYTYTFTLGYDYTDKQTIINMRNQMGAAANDLLSKALATVGPNATDYDKEKAIHNTLVMHCSYDIATANNATAPYTGFTAYGAFVNGKSVCDGYARAMKLLLNSAGIKSLYVSGIGKTSSSSGSHAWNMVYVPDKGGNYSWWYVDATFDDPLISNGDGTYSDISKPSYKYWNFSDKTDHILGKYLPNNWNNSQNYQFMPQAGTLDYYYNNTGIS
jgi:hypothetical protein